VRDVEKEMQENRWTCA